MWDEDKISAFAFVAKSRRESMPHAPRRASADAGQIMPRSYWTCRVA